MYKVPRTFSQFYELQRTEKDLKNVFSSIIEVIKPLNAFTHVYPQFRLSATKDQAVAGVPLAVKDNFCTKDAPTTCGSAMLKDFKPPYDATVVQKAKKAGFAIAGKTNLDEFAMGSGGLDSIFGPCKSLWNSGIPYDLVDKEGNILETCQHSQCKKPFENDDWIVAGGSSSGSAVAVSSGACLAALGSDTGGSVRIPGAWNGIPTLKPTYGSLSRHGLIPLCNSLDVPGLMARCVEDLEDLFRVLRGPDPNDSTTIEIKNESEFDLKKLRIGIPQEYLCSDMSQETIQTWSDVTDLLENSGFEVKSVSLPHTSYSIVCYSVLNSCEVASNMARYDGVEYGLRSENVTSTEAMFADSRHQGFNHVVRERILAGNFFLLKENQPEFFERALKIRRLVKEDFDKVWPQVDLLLTPVTLSEAPTFASFSKLDNRTQSSKQDYCTQPVNLAGLPAATVPVRLSSGSKLPLSLQIIGQRHQDLKVLKLCRWIEAQVHFPQVQLKI